MIHKILNLKKQIIQIQTQIQESQITLKNQKNCFFLQTAILIFATSLKITNENIIQLVKTIH